MLYQLKDKHIVIINKEENYTELHYYDIGT